MLNLHSCQLLDSRDLQDLPPLPPPSSSYPNAKQPPINVFLLHMNNLLAEELKLETCGISTFKAILYKYFMTSLRTYDDDDPRPFKTTCNCVNS